MPAALQGVTYLVPARYFLVVTRGDLPQGRGRRGAAPQGLLMIGLRGARPAWRSAVFRKELA
jgi:ABC-2 type transport system permease protein